MNHLYVHIPFCDGKCSYCGFYSVCYEQDLARQYVAALATELDQAAIQKSPPSTIYFGGGTPSILDADILKELMTVMLSRFSTDYLAEWTVEANPGSLSADKLDILHDAGVNRVSFGAQAFDNNILEQLGRRHNVDDIEDSINVARSSGMDNISIDLIANLPHTDTDGWKRSLELALDLEPEHMSIYDLSIEKGSRFEKDIEEGRISLANEDESLAMLDLAHELLTDAGYSHYEISNYAKPGYECLHNMSYWSGEDYMGFGPSASSRLETTRWSNAPDLDTYIDGLESGSTPPRNVDNLSIDNDLQERFLYGIRLLYGVSVTDFCDRFSPPDNSLIDHWNNTFERLSADGLVELTADRWCLTSKGRHLADHVCRELLR